MHGTESKEARGRGFTLVELLVVIGIIAILISVLLPVLSNARRAGNKTKCLASLHQIGDGFKMYAAENSGYWPVAADFYTDSAGAKDKRWHDFIARYVIGPQSVTDPATGKLYNSKDMNYTGSMGYPGSNNHQMEFGNPVDPVWIGTMRDRDNVLWGCPSWKGSYNIINNVDDYRIPGYSMSQFPFAPDDLTNTTPPGTLENKKRAFRITQGASQAGAGSQVDGGYFKATQWKRQSERVLVYEATHSAGFFSANYVTFPWTDANFPTIPPAASFSLDWNRHGKYRIGNRSSDPSTNVLYCDGHCATVSAREAYHGIRFRD